MRNRIENNGPQNDEESYQSKLKKIYEERRKLQNSIEQIKNEQILNKKKERNFF